jgi:hypothetical protein
MLIGHVLPWLKEHGFQLETDPPMTLPPYYYNKADDTFILTSEIVKARDEAELLTKIGKFRDLLQKFENYQKNLSYGK